MYKYACGILLLCIGISLSGEERNKLISGITLAGLVIACLAIYQYLFGFGHLWNYVNKENILSPFTLDYIARKRPFATFVTPNALAGYLAMICVLGLGRKNKILFVIPIALALLLTKSLGALLSIVLGLTVYFYLKGSLKKRNALLLMGLLLIFGGILISRTASQQPHTQPAFSLGMRLNYWQDTLRIIKAHPVIGVGVGNFNLMYSRYAHNSYLQVWAEMGILGIMALLWLVIALVKPALKNIKDAKKTALPLITAAVVFLIHNFLDFTFFLPEVSLIWWVVLGLTNASRLE